LDVTLPVGWTMVLLPAGKLIDEKDGLPEEELEAYVTDMVEVEWTVSVPDADAPL